jgi:diguanylate cyclase (GGDEF)-like protein
LPNNTFTQLPAGIASLLLLLGSNAWPAEPHPASKLIESGLAAMRTDPEASRRDAEEAIELLQIAPDADLEARARLLLCDYQSERDTDLAEKEAAAADALLDSAKRKGLRAGVLTCRGEIRENLGQNDEALKLYDEAVGVATEAGDEEMLAGALYARGSLLGLRGQYAAGLTDLERSHTLFEKIDLPLHALTLLNAIATLYNRMGDYEQAEHIYTRALKAQTDAGMRREQVVTLHNLARTHENRLEWDEARVSFQQCLEISRELRYARGEAYALRGLAAVDIAQDRAEQAVEKLKEAAALQKQGPDARLGAQIDLALGMALRKLGREVAAAEALTRALKIFEQTDALAELRINYAELAAVHASLGNGQRAYEYSTKAHSTSERLLRNQLDQRFATLKIQFDTVTKEKENALLLRENEANAKALEQGRRVRQLQGAVLLLTAILAVLLATLAVRQRRSTARMRTLAMTDELTGVPNRRAALSRLSGLLARKDSTCAALVVDVDHFKRINDQFGHAEGDRALKAVAATLQGAVTEAGFVGRLGGEEFIVVLPDTDLESAREAAEFVRHRVMKLDTSGWLDRSITVSIGLTVSRSEGDTPSMMLQRADAALYAAKRSGRNCVRVAPDAPARERDIQEPSGGPVTASD